MPAAADPHRQTGTERGGEAGAVSGGLVVHEAANAELRAALDVQHAAFERVARMFGIPPDRLSAVTESLVDLIAQRDAGSSVLVAVVAGCVVGTVRALVRPDGVVEVGRLAVDESFLRQGIGRALMRAVEQAYPKSRRFELFTGAEAEVPLALYEGLGYRTFKRQAGENVDIVWLAKDRGPQ